MRAKCISCKSEIEFSTKKRQCDKCIGEKYITRMRTHQRQRRDNDPFEKMIDVIRTMKMKPQLFYGGSYLL